MCTCEIHPSFQDGWFLNHMESCIHHDTVGHLIGLEPRVYLQQIGCGNLLNNHRWEY